MSSTRVIEIKKYSGNFEELMNRWKPLLNSMALWGLNFKTNRFSLLNIASLVAMKIYCIFMLRLVTAHLENKLSVSIALGSFIPLLFILMTIISFYSFLINKKMILRASIKIFDLMKNNKMEKMKNKGIFIRVILVWSHAIMFSVIMLTFILCSDYATINKYWDINGSFGLNVSENVSLFIVLIFQFIYIIFLMLPQNFFFLFFTTIVRGLENAFEQLLKKINNMGDNWKEIESVPFIYMEIIEISEEIEYIYSKLLFLWAVSIGGNIIFCFVNIVSSLSKSAILDVLPFASLSLFQFCIFADNCNSVSKACDAAENIGRQLYKISLREKDHRNQNFLFSFSLKCQQELPSFTGWKLFGINRNLILVIVSVIITYTVIVSQFD